MHINVIPEGAKFDPRLGELLGILLQRGIILRCHLMTTLLGPKAPENPLVWAGEPDTPGTLFPRTNSCPTTNPCPFTSWEARQIPSLEMSEEEIGWLENADFTCEPACLIRADADLEREKVEIEGGSSAGIDMIRDLLAYLGFPGAAPVAG